MLITNKHNLPEALVRAMQNDQYNKGDSDFTATSLLKPPRIAALEELHAHELQEDAEDSLFRLYGTLAHLAIERSNMNELALAEKRFFANFGLHKVSAMIDNLCLIRGTLADYKFTTAWGFKKGSDPKPDWVAQLNIQLEIMRRNGLDASSLQIVGLLRDWQINKAKEDPGYPQTPVVILDIPMWSREQATNYIEMKISEHLATKERLPECSSEDRWAKPDAWAVIKKGQKRAINGGVQFSKELAEKISSETPGTFVEHRPGESVRCQNYCPVAKFCTQYQASLNQEEVQDEISQRPA